MSNLVGKKVTFKGRDVVEKYHDEYKPYYGKVGVVIQDDSEFFGELGEFAFPFEVKFEDGSVLPFSRNEIEVVGE